MRWTALFTRMLVGADGSDRGEEAVRQAARLAALSGSDLEVAWVFDTMRLSALSPIGTHDHRRVGEDALQEATGLAEKEEVETRAQVLVGDPARALLRESVERWADLICLGPDSGFARRNHLLGGVAKRVLRLAPCSVLIARHPPGGLRFPGRILCAVDGSGPALEAVRRASALARVAASDLLLLHAGRGGRGDDPTLETTAGLARSEGIDPLLEPVSGHAAEAIVAGARRFEADLVVLGSRGLRGIRRLVGGVSDPLARHLPCSVLVVRNGRRRPSVRSGAGGPSERGTFGP